MVWDAVKYSWSQKVPNGNSPAPRYNHCSTVYQGLNLIIFGGEDETGSFSEFYMYNFDTNTWSMINTDITVSSRTSCCMTSYENFIIVHGGETAQSGAIGTTMILNMHTNTIKVIKSISSYNLDVRLMNHKCWIYTETNSPLLILSVGEKNDLNPSSAIYAAPIDNLSTQTSFNWYILINNADNKNYNWASSGIVVMGNWFIQVGGTKQVLYASSQINLISLNNQTLSSSLKYSNSKIYWYKHGLEHFGRNLTTAYSGATSGHLIKKEFITSHMYLITPELFEMPYFLCSTGTYGVNCESCPIGTYSDIIGAQECKKCPLGTIGKYIAATSIYMCFPCEMGSYSDTEGAIRCLNCRAADFCPVGSIEPAINSSHPAMHIIRPDTYSVDISDPFDGKVYYIFYFSIVIVGFLFFWYPSVRRFIRKIDYFSEKHSINDNEPMMKFKTSLGGAFTMVFLVFAMIYFYQLLFSYFNNNIRETKNLVPSVTLDKIFIAESFNITTELIHYKGDCIDNEADSNICSKFLYTETTDVNWVQECRLIDKGLCLIEMKCENCEIPGDVEIFHKMCEFGSFASAIRVNVSSSSSIPGGLSQVSYFIKNYEGKVFRGSDPSIFNFEITKSVFFTQLFTTDSSDWISSNTGYHVSSKSSPTEGTQSTAAEYFLYRIYSEMCISIKIVIDMANAILVTQRNFQYNFIIVITAGLGSVFGVLEIFALGLNTMEKGEDYFRKKHKKNANFSLLLGKRNEINLSFLDEGDEESAKITNPRNRAQVYVINDNFQNRAVTAIEYTEEVN